MTIEHLTKKQLAALSAGLTILFLLFIWLAFPQAQTTITDPLVQQADLTYVGAFRVPNQRPDDQHTFSYGGRSIAYDARDGGIWMVGHDQKQWVAEMSVPTPSPSTSLNDLPRSTLVHDFRDMLGGKMGAIGQNGVFVGGIFPWESGFIVSAYTYYDASKKATASHVVVASDGAVSGPYLVGSNPGFTAGWMTTIPKKWQASLGGPALTGQCCIPIISRTSLGPTATVFNPSDMANQTNAKMVIGYPHDHPTLGTYEDDIPSNLFIKSTSIGGMIFPDGTSSVLFFGSQPATSCYGQGTSDKSLDRKPVPGTGTIYCYDPTSIYKGTHGYPWRGFVWAYDAHDLVSVKNGQKNPWDIKPYATWTLTAPFMGDSANAIIGATYDSAMQLVYLSLGGADKGGSVLPLIAAFKLSVGAAVQPIPIDAVVSDWSGWEPVSSWSDCSEAGSQIRKEYRTRTVTASAANGGTTPALEEARTVSQSCTPLPVMVAYPPSATITSATCVIRNIRAKMPSGGGWRAEFFDGDRSLGSDAGGPATRPAQTVSGGVHALTVRWTKAGHDPIVTPPLVLECR